MTQTVYTYMRSAAAMAVAAASFVFAADAQAKDLGELKAGVKYTYEANELVTATYKPTVTQRVRMIFQGIPVNLFTTPTGEAGSKVDYGHDYTDAGTLRDYYKNLVAGQTYYIYAKPIGAGSFEILEGQQEILLLSTRPSADVTSPDYYGGKFSVSSNYRVSFNFNTPVNCGAAYVIAPGNNRIQAYPMKGSSSVSIDIADAAMKLYRSGNLKEGDELQIQLTQVVDAADESNSYPSRVRATYVMAAKPIELIGETNISKTETNFLNSFYLKGAEDGIVTLEFDGPVTTKTPCVAGITYGNPDNLDVGIYSESIRGNVDGSKVSFDFSGKLRRRADMLPAGDESTWPAVAGVSFADIRSEDGQRAYTGAVANARSFDYTLRLRELQYDIAADFTPADGGTLYYDKDMEIWVMNGDKIRFDAVCFAYKEAGQAKTVEVPMEEITVTNDEYSDDARIYTFKVPVFNADKDTPVDLTVKNLTVADGLNHNADIRASFAKAEAYVNAVEGIEAEEAEGSSDVFTLTGVRVLRDADASQIRTLEKGIYIWKGRKIVIK